MIMPITADALIAHFDYTQYASMKLVNAALTLPEEELIRDLKSSHGGILGTLTHIYMADQVWLFRHEDPPVSVASLQPLRSLTVADLQQLWPPLYERFKIRIAELGDDGVLREFTYKNLAGVEFTMPRWHTLLHVVNHGTLHRGQVMTMFRQLGHQPPSTDLINYYRDLMVPSR